MLPVSATLAAIAVSFCSSASSVGDSCNVKLDELRPTQFAVGMIEVEKTAAEICGNDVSIEGSKKIPVVLGPNNTTFLTDRHHHALAMLKFCGIDVAKAKVQENWSSLSWKEFWAKMVHENDVYLFDENGKARDTSELPHALLDLKDDPYRSLAAEVRDAGGYEKTDELFAEFRWAQYFRTRVTIAPDTGSTHSGFHQAVKEALKLAHDPSASGLPGYLAP